MRLACQHLTHLFNALYAEGITAVSVKHPCDDIGELFEIDISDPLQTTIRFTQGALTYQDRRDSVLLQHGKRAYCDLPDKENYVRALVAGGLITVENQTELEAFFHQQGYPDLDAGHAPLVLGIDTNLLGWRLTDALRLDPDQYSDDQGRSPINGFAFATGIYDELHWQYRHYETRPLEEAFGPEFARLDNQPAGANRAGLLGRYEYRRFRDQYNAVTIDSQQGDEAIIEAYANYDRENRQRVLLLSNDYEFVRRARETGVLAHHVCFPIDMPQTVTVSWDELQEVLYTLAILFGVLQLPKVTLYSVWDGKSGEDWQRRRLDVVTQSETVSKKLHRDRAIMNDRATEAESD